MLLSHAPPGVTGAHGSASFLSANCLKRVVCIMLQPAAFIIRCDRRPRWRLLPQRQLLTMHRTHHVLFRCLRQLSHTPKAVPPSSAPPTPRTAAPAASGIPTHSLTHVLFCVIRYFQTPPSGVTDAQGGTSFLSATNPAALLAPPMAAAAGSMSSAVLSALRSPYDALAENTARHCAGLPAHHAVVCGPPGAGKSWLLWEGTLLAGKDCQTSYSYNHPSITCIAGIDVFAYQDGRIIGQHAVVCGPPGWQVGFCGRARCWQVGAAVLLWEGLLLAGGGCCALGHLRSKMRVICFLQAKRPGSASSKSRLRSCRTSSTSPAAARATLACTSSSSLTTWIYL